MNDRLTALKLFARAARVGSLSGAGRELGLSQPSASRLIAALEAEPTDASFRRENPMFVPHLWFSAAASMASAPLPQVIGLSSFAVVLFACLHRNSGDDDIPHTSGGGR
jgi:hypothetical protein